MASFWVKLAVLVVVRVCRSGLTCLYLHRHRVDQRIGSWRATSMLSENLGMGLQIAQREKEAIVILDLKGTLVVGDEELSLLQRLLSVLDTGHRNVILNFNAVSDVDTSGLGTLIFCAMRFQESGGRLALLNLATSNTKLFDLMKLDSAFEAYQDEQTAVNSFFPERRLPRYDILKFVEEQEHFQESHAQRCSEPNR